MKYTRFDNIEDFMKKCEGFLRERAAENNLLLGICGYIKEDSSKFEGYYLACVEEDLEIKLVSVMTMPRNLLLDSRDDKALDFFLDEFVKEGYEVPGTNGRKETSLKAVKFLSEKYNKTYECAMNLRIYKLTEVVELDDPAGRFVQASQEHQETLAEWMYYATIDFGFEPEAEVDDPVWLEKAQVRIDKGVAYLWLDENDVPVTMAMRSRDIGTSETVSMVYTPKELRRRGYATACVKELSRVILNRGKEYATLFTDLANPISNSIYMKMGYKPICDYDEYSIVEK